MATRLERLEPVATPLVLVRDKWFPEELKARIRRSNPKSELDKTLSMCLRYLPAEQAAAVLERITSCVIMESALRVEVMRHPDSPFRHGGPCYEDYGITSRKKVGTAGVAAMAVAWGAATFAMLYMALGTDATAEANTQSLPIVEIAANHYTSNRPTCTHVHSTNTIPLVGVHTQATAGDTIAEHVIADSATQGAGVGWDRSLTGAVVMGVADTFTGTLTVTLNAEA